MGHHLGFSLPNRMVSSVAADLPSFRCLWGIKEEERKKKKEIKRAKEGEFSPVVNPSPKLRCKQEMIS